MTQPHGKQTTPTHGGSGISDEVIRLCAYQKWEAARKPFGGGARFWLEAEQELMERMNEAFIQRGVWHGNREDARLDADKAVNECSVTVDSHYRDNNRMFQSHGERGHRHGGTG
jgi:Protein of unknown function (DUF2934)